MKLWFVLFTLLALGLAASALRSPAAPAAHAAPAASGLVLGGEPILPLPREVNWDPVKASLGERLFHDRGMSASQNIACASCHDMGKGGADGQVRSMQSDGKLTLVNTPTLYNVAYSAKLFWNGRADTLWQEFEMNKAGGVNWKILPARFGADTQYAQSFARLYPKEGITVHTIRDALFNYEQSLVTPNARFDRYLRGERQAITAAELQGYRLFKSYGCVSCHQGVNIGGNLFQKLGVMTDYFSERGTPLTAADNGRYEVTHHEEDRYVFRVPSLRNVALTAPYFHDGTAKTLQAAIADMAEHQLGIRMPGKDGILIEGFLKTLTGEYRGRALAP